MNSFRSYLARIHCSRKTLCIELIMIKLENRNLHTVDHVDSDGDNIMEHDVHNKHSNDNYHYFPWFVHVIFPNYLI